MSSDAVVIQVVPIDTPEDVNVVVGMAHFIKTVEDIHECVVSSVPGARFGLAFCEASGVRLIRRTGNDEELEMMAVNAAEKVGCGHTFFLMLRECFPINILPALKNVPEVCHIWCATANPLQALVVETAQGRGMVGVVDGGAPLGVEGDEEIAERKELLRKLGYKL